MDASRRDFLQLTATAASALSLVPFGLDAAPGAPAVEAPDARDPGVRANEARQLRARPVPLGKVRLTGGPLKHAQDLMGTYLLSLDPDRMLSFFRQRAGLDTKAEPYPGWDAGGHNLTGHIAGHHLSAVSLMYLATGDDRFKQRADVLVAGLKEVQDKQGDGFLCALEGGREKFDAVSKGDIRAQAFDLNGMWSPWYVLHKTFAGLRDAYRHAGNRTALDVSVKFAGWAERLLAPLSDTQMQHMLLTEHGGMNEVLSDLYADTGDTRWLRLSLRFEHHAFTDALKRHEDNLNGKHGNCQIPKLVGSAARYGYTGDAQDIMAASFFWDRVVQHHSYATGGHGLDEYFGPADQLSTRVDGRVAESCNVYNMLKLTRRLFSLRPDPFYADFHERALFNHVLGSMDANDGRVSYMVPVGRGVMQEYQNMLRDFTCCVGSGMESHALHGDGLYYESDDTVWVNLFAPSTAELASGVHLKMDTGFPDGDTATLTIAAAAAPKAFTLAVRRPSWAGDGFAIAVNGTALDQPPLASFRPNGAGGRNVPGLDPPVPPGTYVSIARTWQSGDVVQLTLPKSLRLEPTPDDPRIAAVLWGPLVLAADLGPRPERQGGGGPAAGGATPPAIPMLVAADRPPSEWIAAAGQPGNFTIPAVARTNESPAAPTPVSLTPFYRTHRRIYSLYFDFFTPAEWDTHAAALAAERERLRRLEEATVAYVRPGDQQSEASFKYQSDPDRQPTRGRGRTSRGGTGWFSYDLPVDAASPMALVVTYQAAPAGSAPAGPAPRFDILVDGTSVAHDEASPKAGGYYDVQYAIPAALVRGKTSVTVKFQAAEGGRIAPIFGVRMIRAN